VEASSADPDVVDRELTELVAKLEGEGRKVYNAVTDKFSKVAGTCGYLLAAMELMDQLEAQGARVDHIFMAAGSSTAGLALAGKLLGAGYKVHPVSVGGSRAEIEESVCRLANGVAELLEVDERLEPGDIAVHDEYVGERYGVPTAAGLEAMALAGRREGLILDPVYTAKAFSAMVDQVRRGAIGAEETVVFVHSGGLPIVFAYSEEILEGMAPAY
jgi:1-aminocyclopropane-1-carboxylate deaminase/D-cysteine desulfhydrase-like pyridoxal-dependent ACC family enzyme